MKNIKIYKNTTCIVILLFFFFLEGCSWFSSTKRELKMVLKMHVNIDYISNVEYKGETYDFDSLRHNIKYFSIVYLEHGCLSCYPKFKEWHDQLKKFQYPENYGVLFIINGKSLYEDLSKDTHIDLNGNFYIHIDNTNSFLDLNESLPRWAINHSVVVDYNNRIQMIGSPWTNNEMTELLFSICSH